MRVVAINEAGQSTVGPTPMSLTCLTGGQRAAAQNVGDAIRSRRPLIVLFGDNGSGKTSMIRELLAALEPDGLVAVGLSATGGDLLGPPTFETLLEAVCKRLNLSNAGEPRPATLANLAAAVGAIAAAGKTIVISIDHADRLSNDVIVEVIRLHDYLDVAPHALLRIFVGSLDLVSRLDAAVRRVDAEQNLAEVRLSQPTAEELASILAYEDNARPEGPMLTPGAIERISAYAKCNLHWAVPMADAARALAEDAGERQVTPELVRKALLDIWSPDDQPPLDAALPSEQHNPRLSDARAQAPSGLSDSVHYQPPIGSQASCVEQDRASGRSSLKTRNRLALASAVGLLAFLAGLGLFAYFAGWGGVELVSPHAGSAVSIPESPRGQSAATPVTRPVAEPPLSSPALGTAVTPSEDDRRPDEPPSRVKAPASGPAAEDPEAGSKVDEEGALSVAAPTTPSTAPASRPAKPLDAPAAQEGALPEAKLKDVSPTPKRPDEKTPKPWVQVR